MDGDERSTEIRALNIPAIDRIAGIHARGVEAGWFRPGIRPLELHWQISALCFFNVSNRATFSGIFGHDFGTPETLGTLRRNVVDMVLRDDRIAGQP